jgi:hypothetical protein
MAAISTTFAVVTSESLVKVDTIRGRSAVGGVLSKGATLKTS